jgi:hypothetical protein
MYASPDETLATLESVGYFTDQKTATTVSLAGKLHRPIMGSRQKTDNRAR